ncbi:hypothetical protein [Winogradskyella vincentii]|uniref:DUF4468 domain-containing protein n=1 Tax=Winogradskyella vincentii TaxID=2877122 RepID=A0ABS7Y3E0_9FLAO|nr:hypothetical protein [Winogradskyella vincentii]MCA0153764.1 hypothetical protein [Winogradskyella vincentii]
MKHLLFSLSVLVSISMFGQDKFEITEEGLTPKSITISSDASDTYTKALQWLEANTENYDITIAETIENETIQFTSTKGNATSLDKQYFNAKYSITMTFTADQYTFRPTAIDLKQNSKYDMGWKPFDLNNANPYFKKGKPIRKYRAYLSGITTPLNTLYIQLTNALKNN